jgi:hypothetical protein
MTDAASHKCSGKFRRIADALVEELLPFIPYLIHGRELRAKMSGDNLQVSHDTLACYKKLTPQELEIRIREEHERAKLLDEKTFRMTLSLSLALTIVGSVVAKCLKDIATSPIATAMQYGMIFSLVYILIGGYIALTSLRTLPTFGYGTAFKVAAKTAADPVEVYVDALLRQETANQIRQVRNEAAFQHLRNGCIPFAIVLTLYLLILVRVVPTGLPGGRVPGTLSGSFSI